MPMLVVVLSVHHTGTKFVYRHLLADDRGWEFVVPNPDTVHAFTYLPKGKKGKVRIHIDPPLMPRVHAWAKDFPTIVPLRHPRAVAKSWKTRNKDMNWLGTQWDLLKNEVDKYNPYYLPLNDSELREEFLIKAEKGLGVRFPHDWPIVMPGVAVENDEAELDEQDEEFIKNWMADGFFERFGYEY